MRRNTPVRQNSKHKPNINKNVPRSRLARQQTAFCVSDTQYKSLSPIRNIHVENTRFYHLI